MEILSIEHFAKTLSQKKDEQKMARSFKMDFSYVPTNEKPIISLAGNPICSVGNICMIIAPPGTGKSNVCEACAAGAVNPDCDALGFEVNSKRTLFIDTERVLNDLAKGLRRIKNRAEVSEEELMEKLDIRSMIFIDQVLTCKEELAHITSVNKFDLVIIDGSADFVKSVNDEEEVKLFWRWLIALANKNCFGVLLTIHPNPGDEQGKATGHLGSQGQKKAESVFNVFKSPDDKDIRMITSDSAHGKVRNAMDKLSTNFKWDNDKRMFVSCESAVRLRVSSVVDMFRSQDFYSFTELCKEFVKKTGKSLSTAKRNINDSLEIGDIVCYQGLYWLPGTQTDEIGHGGVVEEDEEMPF